MAAVNNSSTSSGIPGISVPAKKTKKGSASATKGNAQRGRRKTSTAVVSGNKKQLSEVAKIRKQLVKKTASLRREVNKRITELDQTEVGLEMEHNSFTERANQVKENAREEEQGEIEKLFKEVKECLKHNRLRMKDAGARKKQLQALDTKFFEFQKTIMTQLGDLEKREVVREAPAALDYRNDYRNQVFVSSSSGGGNPAAAAAARAAGSLSQFGLTEGIISASYDARERKGTRASGFVTSLTDLNVEFLKAQNPRLAVGEKLPKHHPLAVLH